MTINRLVYSTFGIIGLLVAWEIGAFIVAAQSSNPAIVWPHLSQIVGTALPALATVDTTGAQQMSSDGAPSFWGAIHVLVSQSLVTAGRVFLGTTIGAVLGVALGFVLATVPWFRMMFSPVLQTLRQVPLFALTLLFVIWFGGSAAGIITFVVFGTALTLMVATEEAIASVPDIHLKYARTLGANSSSVVRTVVAPAIVPTLSSTLLVVFGLAWAMVMAAEFLGTQEGLGRLILFFQMFQHTDRMVVVAATLTFLALLTHLVLVQVVARVTRWVPRAEDS